MVMTYHNVKDNTADVLFTIVFTCGCDGVCLHSVDDIDSFISGFTQCFELGPALALEVV
jgi:hypothetical protein